ncbi:hypothetical protein CPB97_004874, partial [Podila verticillata]
LQQEVFPFIEEHFKDHQGYEDWQQWLENIMLDRNVYYKRETTKHMEITFVDVLKVRMLLLLAHLRKVILQDAIALINLPQEPFLYGDHRILQHSIFKGPLFLKFKEDLLESMATAISPMSDSLMANAPAIHNEFSTVNTRMNQFEHEICQLFQASNAQTAKELKRLEEVLVNQHSTFIGATNQNKIELIMQFWSAVRDISLSISNTAHTAQLNFLSSLGPGLLDKQVKQQPIEQQCDKQQCDKQQRDKQQHDKQLHNDQQHNEQQYNEQQYNEQQRIGQHLENPPVAQISHRQPSSKERQTSLKTELASQYVHYPPTSVDLVDVMFLSRSEPLRRQWKEWFQGTEGRPAIWSLNKTFRTKWHKGHGNTLAKTFSVKKTIIYSILDIMLEIEGATLNEREESALQVMEDQLKVMTLNRYYLKVARGKGQPVS